jgi:NAD-dependent SIR2 family protein deacetylase
MEIQKSIEIAAKEIFDAEALIITAGAGIGVDSGLPDFRGNEGFWKAYPPIAKLGYSFSDMANPYWFEKNPKLAWAFYGHRLNLYRNTIPHSGFMQLLEIGNSKPYKYFVYTSNVDGQFQKAGFESNRIEECHGSIHHSQCTKPCSNYIWDSKDTIIGINEQNFEAIQPLPTCPKCGEIARPNILMFGDSYWLQGRTSEQSEKMHSWINELKTNKIKTVIIELGAGKAIATVRYKSEYLSNQLKAKLIRINPRDFEVSGSNISIPLGSKEGVGLIYNALNGIIENLLLTT